MELVKMVRRAECVCVCVCVCCPEGCQLGMALKACTAGEGVPRVAGQLGNGDTSAQLVTYTTGQGPPGQEKNKKVSANFRHGGFTTFTDGLQLQYAENGGERQHDNNDNNNKNQEDSNEDEKGALQKNVQH